MTMIELAERCEKATGPSRHLDTQIFILLDPDAEHIIGSEPGRWPQNPIYGPRSTFWEWACDESKGPPEFAPIPLYTASLDAAMTLDPPGINAVPLWNEAIERCWRETHLLGGEGYPEAFRRRLPAFRAAASLRSRAAQPLEKSGEG